MHGRCSWNPDGVPGTPAASRRLPHSLSNALLLGESPLPPFTMKTSVLGTAHEIWQRGALGLACVWEVNTEASCWQSWNTDQTFAEPPVVLQYLEVQLSRTGRVGGGGE